MPSKLHQPITEEHGNIADSHQGNSSSANRNSLEQPQLAEQAREMPMPMPVPYLGEALPRTNADTPDPQLSSTASDLFEDRAPTYQQRTWNGEYARGEEQSQGYQANPSQQQTGMREPMLPDGDDMYSPAPPVGPSAAGSLGRQSQTVECPWCHAVVSTRVRRKIGAKAGGAAVLVALIAWPLFWVPLLVPGLQRKTHYCPSCNRRIGRGRRNV
ncbi:hypothetical protein GGH95_005370 [Coemansia sp. RSA 1836]|nr:hypothetical protein GGH95_005370 [Coemansia sp. RSA 1836]